MPQKPHIIAIVQNLPLPQDRKLMDTLTVLVEAGYCVYAISPAQKSQKPFEIIQNIKIYRYKPYISKGSSLFGYFLEYTNAFIKTFWLAGKIYFYPPNPQGGLRKSTGGVIHITNPPDLMFPIAVFFKIFDLKFVFDHHDLVPEMLLAKFKAKKTGFLYKLLVFFEKLTLKSADLHIVTCESAKQLTRKRHNFKAKTVIIRNSIDLQPFEIKQKNPIYLPLHQGENDKLKDNVPSLMKGGTGWVFNPEVLCAYVGVMGLQDGLKNLIESINYVVNGQGRTDIGFVLMGDGDDLKNIKQRVKDYNLAKNVIFTGWVDKNQMASYLKQAQIGLMPEPQNDYTHNSLHNKVLEYMAAGLPFVMYELKEDKKTAKEAALYIKKEDPIAFGNAIIKLADDEKLRKKMGDYGKKRFKSEKYGFKYQKESLIEAYSSLNQDGQD
ncbi:MAG: glycosyltransferase [Candidatus Moranbacteria bacterium]|nr:glycosyltransferase [Candidatus Moranbacteria bacterium]